MTREELDPDATPRTEITEGQHAILRNSPSFASVCRYARLVPEIGEVGSRVEIKDGEVVLVERFFLKGDA